MVGHGVQLTVDLDAEVFHIGAGTVAQLRVVLTHTGSPYDGIQTIHCGSVCADVSLDLVCERWRLRGTLSCRPCRIAASMSRLSEEMPEIPRKPHFLFMYSFHLRRECSPHLFHDERNHSGVHTDRSGFPSAHLPEGSKPIEVSMHLPPLTAVIEEPLPMWQVMILVSSSGLVEKLCHLTGYIAVRGAVRTVAADVVLFVHIVGNAVHISLHRHGLVESCVKYRVPAACPA